MPRCPTRQPVYGRAAVASSQPLATAAGVETLLNGGNAVDAAVAVAAALAVTEPCSNGVGGDCFALLYDRATRSVTAVHGNGAAPAALTPALLGAPPVNAMSPHTITVPGAVAGWIDLVSQYGSGKLTLQDVLSNAIRLADDGFPVGPVAAEAWKSSEQILKAARGGGALLVAGERSVRAPKAGEVFRNPELAETFRAVAKKGFDGFYRGSIAQSIVDTVRALGGVMTLNDLAEHRTEIREPLMSSFRGFNVYETGAPTHGVVALMALKVLNGFAPDLKEEDAMHVMIEAIRMAFGDVSNVVADPNMAPDVTAQLIADEHANKLRSHIRLDQRAEVHWETTMPKGGTVQFCVVDKEGNAVSMIQSNYMGFGTGHVPKGTGFSLNNRGLNFAAGKPGHMNAPAGGKKPYHTIIPALMTRKDGNLFAALGVMGSFMQPQGHVQVIRRLVDCRDSAQAALDRPRFRVTGPFSSVEEGMGRDEVLVEPEMDRNLAEELKKKGHVVRVGQRGLFGKGQVCVLRGRGVVEAGSDNRADGCAAVL